MDNLTPKKRSWNMSRIRSKNTKPEAAVRSWLFRHGFRFRKNDQRYPGKPDVVLPKYRTVIFVNGCFWHHHEGCRLGYIPKTRTEFWLHKFRQNQINDIVHREQLQQMKWKVITIWECELKKDFDGIMNRVSIILQKQLINKGC